MEAIKKVSDKTNTNTHLKITEKKIDEKQIERHLSVNKTPKNSHFTD